MQYKTIVLELIREQPQLHQRLTSSKTLLSTMNLLACDLRSRHLQLIEEHQKGQPQWSRPQHFSETLELAIEGIISQTKALA